VTPSGRDHFARPTPAAPATGSGTPVRPKLIFGIVSVALLMSSIDQTIVATALPTLARDLHTQMTWASWTITIYSLSRVMVLPLAGKLSDLYGRRTIFIGSVALFTLASLMCGLVSSISLLVVLRAVQAIGGSAFMPSATGLVVAHFGRNRDRAVGLFVSVPPIGALIGPVVGGVFVTYWSWRWIFLVNVPIGILLVALASKYIPRGEAVKSDQPLDIVGGLALSGAILVGMLGVSLLGNGDVALLSLDFLAPEVVAVALLVWFLRHISRSPHPFIPLRMLYGASFGTLNIMNFLYGGAVLGFGALVPLYAAERFGISAFASGTLLNARAIGMMITAFATSMLLKKTGVRWPMGVGFILTSVGMIAMSADAPLWTPHLWLAVSAWLTGLGMGTVGPASMNASLNLATTDIAAVVSLRQMFRQTGSIIAIAVSTAIAARSDHPGVVLGHVFETFGIVMLCVLPLLCRVPHQRGEW